MSIKKRKFIVLCSVAALIGLVATVIAKVLLLSIAFFTNLFWFQSLSTHHLNLGEHQFSPPYILIPVLGGIIVGLMARYGSKAIRGHGIPEVWRIS